MKVLVFPALLGLLVLAGCDATAPDAESIDFDSLPALATGTTVVTASGLAPSLGVAVRQPTSWFFYDDERDQVVPSLGAFVSGQGTPPAGSGSVKITSSGTQRRALATYRFGKTSLADITALGFSTYNPSAGNGGSDDRSAYLGMSITFDGSATYQNRIGFVPRRNGTVVQDTWQHWDALDGGNALWVWSGYADNGGEWPDGNTSVERTWSDLVASFPNLAVSARYPWVGMRVGSPYADGYTEYLDRFEFGVDGNTHVWDFEP